MSRFVGSDRPHLGRWLEDLPAGLVIDHAVTRTITESDNTLFSVMTMNPQPLHLDESFADDHRVRDGLVNSLLTLSLLIGLSVYETTHGTTVANLGFEEIGFPIPVFIGDSIRAQTEVALESPVVQPAITGHRRVRASGLQSAGHTRRHLPTISPHALPPGMTAPWRSMLFVPGNRPDLAAKAPRSTPHVVVLDLEDAVPPAGKLGGPRDDAGGRRPPEGLVPVCVRVNPPGTTWFADDVASLPEGLAAVVVPKLESADQYRQVCRGTRRAARRRRARNRAGRGRCPRAARPARGGLLLRSRGLRCRPRWRQDRVE